MKKILSIILVLTMIASLFVNTGVVFATDANYVARVGDVYFEDLMEAWAYALETGGDLVMLSDVDLNDTLVNPGDTGLSGEGTEESPYLINNLDDLKWFRDDVNAGNNYKGKFVKLTADIDLYEEDAEGNQISWTPIGDMDVDKITFHGTFDGDNHTISNLYIYAADTGLAFFGRTGSFDEGTKAVVKNIIFNNVDVSSTITTGHGGSYVGGVIANSSANTTVSNVHLKGYIYVAGYGYVGGIVAHGYPKIDNCSVIAEDSSYIHCYYWCAGGIVGYGGEGSTTIKKCKSFRN